MGSAFCLRQPIWDLPSGRQLSFRKTASNQRMVLRFEEPSPALDAEPDERERLRSPPADIRN